MTIGRKPMPAHLQLISGTKSRSTYSKQPNWIEQQKRKLRAPKTLSLAQKVIWRDFVRHSAAGHLQLIDIQILHLLVIHVDLFHQIERKLSASMLLIKTPNGMPQQSPFVGMLNKQTRIIQGLLADLGFTPTERARLGILNPEPEDDRSDYFD